MIEFEAVIGLEVHAQLSTQTKLFCGCSTAFGAPPNSQTCPVCLALPGALPVPNEKAVEYAVMAALALDCDIQAISEWSRKNYFYPDLPKGYQITQFDKPYALGGGVEITGEKQTTRKIELVRIHMEEDAGKNIHSENGDYSLIDFNRASVPLIEIVSQPQLRTPEEAAQYLRRLRQILVSIGVCDGNMEQGSFRCDANVSIRPRGEKKLGTRVELKNINSFKFVTQAIHFEIVRQEQVITSGQSVVQETRLWDSNAKLSKSMRRKEEADDYRYFPDPDLPLLLIDSAFIDQLRRHLPELPQKKLARFVSEMGLSHYDAQILTDDHEVAQFFEQAMLHYHAPKTLANLLISQVMGWMNAHDQIINKIKIAPKDLASLAKKIDADEISGKIAKEILTEILQTGESPEQVMAKKDLIQIKDTSLIEAAAKKIIADNPKQHEQYQAGKIAVFGYFVGQLMKATQGKANPGLANEILKKLLDEK